MLLEAKKSGLLATVKPTIDDLTKMVAALRHHEAMTAFVGDLPERIKTFDGEALAKVRKQLDVIRQKHTEALPFALAVLTRRLKAPWQLIRLATKVAKSKDAGNSNGSVYS